MSERSKSPPADSTAPNRPVPFGRCPQCAYDLRGLTEPRCPECGRAFTFHEIIPVRRLWLTAYPYEPRWSAALRHATGVKGWIAAAAMLVCLASTDLAYRSEFSFRASRLAPLALLIWCIGGGIKLFGFQLIPEAHAIGPRIGRIWITAYLVTVWATVTVAVATEILLIAAALSALLTR